MKILWFHFSLQMNNIPLCFNSHRFNCYLSRVSWLWWFFSSIWTILYSTFCMADLVDINSFSFYVPFKAFLSSSNIADTLQSTLVYVGHHGILDIERNSSGLFWFSKFLWRNHLLYLCVTCSFAIKLSIVFYFSVYVVYGICMDFFMILSLEGSVCFLCLYRYVFL